jgi:hypothetical protein
MTDLSTDQITFLKRALPHFMAGKSVEDAMRAVLDDDARLLNALHSNRAVSMSQGAMGDGSPMQNYDYTDAAKTIRSAITTTVYEKLRA